MSPNYIVIRAAKGGLLADLKLGLQQGGKPNITDEQGYPALQLAALSGSLPCIQVLLDAGADIDAENEHCQTAVQICTQENRIHSAIYLLDQGADGSDVWPDGRNVLHFGAVGGHLALLSRGVRQGANIHGATRKGMTPVMVAATAGQADSVRRLLELGAHVKHLAGLTLSPQIESIASAWHARAMVGML